MTVIERVQVLLPNADEDIITELYDVCVDDFLNYTNLTTLPTTTANTCLVNMVLVRYNQLGNDGINSTNFNGVSESYVEGYPTNVLKQMQRFRKVVVC